MSIKPGYIRVSEILSQWDRFGHIDPQVLQDKANLGTEVHRVIDEVSSGMFTDEYLLPEKARKYLRSFRLWKNEGVKEWKKGEQRLYCEVFKITGQIDAFYQFPGENTLTIIDYKTSATASPKDWELQGTFYHHLAKVNGYLLSDRFLFLQLDKDGELPKVHEFKVRQEMITIMISALNCYKWRNSL